MIAEKLQRIIELLTEKTRAKKAIWNKSSGNNQFKLSINDGSAVTITEWSDNYNNITYEVTIFNSNGDAIERFNTDLDGSSKEDYHLLQTFHKAASDSYYKVEETMDALFDSISNQDVIGNKQEEEKPNLHYPDDDDLPF
jgi:hypothetical protein